MEGEKMPEIHEGTVYAVAALKEGFLIPKTVDRIDHVFGKRQIYLLHHALPGPYDSADLITNREEAVRIAREALESKLAEIAKRLAALE